MRSSKIKLSLRWKIVLFITVIVFSVGMMVVWLVNRNMRTALLDSKKETIRLVSAEQTKVIGQVMKFARQAADAVPDIPGIANYLEDKDKEMQDQEVLDNLIHFGEGRQFLVVFLMEPDGHTVLSTDTTLLDKNFGFRKYFNEALAGNSYTEMVVGSVTKEPGFFFSSPVKNSRGEVVGVSVIKLNPQPIFDTMADSYINELGKFMLVNDDGVVVFTNKEDALYKSLGNMDEGIRAEITKERRYLVDEILPMEYDQIQTWVENKVDDTPVYDFYDEEDNERELVQLDRVEGYSLFFVSEIGYESVVGVIDQIIRTLIFIIVIALVFGVVTQILFLGRILGPLPLLESYARAVAKGSYDEKVSVNSGDELESLSLSIKEMVASLRGMSAGLEKKVAEKTKELEETLSGIEEKNLDLENTKKAVMNVMEDLSVEKDLMTIEKSRLETILKSIGDGVFVTDSEGKVTLINRAAQEMCGLGALQVMGKHYVESLNFRMEDDFEKGYPDFVGKVLETGEAQSLENHTVIIRNDGLAIPVLDSAAPIKDIGGRVYGCVVVFRNNTRERELEKSKDDFLSVTSHQLRTPLGSMRWNLEMLLAGDAGKLPKEAEMIATEVHKGNIRMIGLVNDLLNVNRIDQGRVLDEPVKAKLDNVVQAAVEELKFEAKARKIKIKLSLAKVPEVVIDAKRFREVIMNLVSNAVKYNKAGGVVDVVMKKNKENIDIYVQDNGVGIPKNDIPKLFNKFFRATNAVQSETEGSGLGLYVVKKFVEGWGGKINLESKEGKGTKISISLPIENIKQKKNG